MPAVSNWGCRSRFSLATAVRIIHIIFFTEARAWNEAGCRQLTDVSCQRSKRSIDLINPLQQ